MASRGARIGRSSTKQPVGAYETTRMVGRMPLRQRILAMLQEKRDRPVVVFLTGEGGIGKTRFLRELVQTEGSGLDAVRMEKIVDLYHVIHHTPEGLAQAIWDALPRAQSVFWDYEREQKLYQQMRLAGDLRRSSAQRQRMLDAFGRGLAELSRERTVLVVLDTAERALYCGPDVSEIQPYEVAASWRWLAELLPDCGSLVLVVAGREQSLRLREFFPQGDAVDVQEETILPFSIEESLDYFHALVETAREKGDETTPRHIQALGDTVLQNLHDYAGGLPILLALFVDLLAVTGQGGIPEELRRDPHSVPEHERSALRQQLEAQLIARLVSSPLGDTLRALGRAPKGTDVDLLAALRETSPSEAERELAQMVGLSFVKTRPGDQRVFLHDVLYEMLERHVYDHRADAPEAAKAADAIDRYYRERLDQVHVGMQNLLQPILDGTQESLDLEALDNLAITRQDLLAERVFYLLRRDFSRGFEFYYRYAHETIFSGQVLLDLLLQAELIAGWSEASRKSQAVDVLPGLVQATLAMRPVARAWAAGNYEEATKLAEVVRQDHPELFSDGDPIHQTILGIWESLSYVYLGEAAHLQEAHRLLNESIENLDRALDQGQGEDVSSTQVWWMRTTLASALRGRGYLHWSQGHLGRSAQDYRRAARLGRDVNVLVELARTLNDLGFTLAERGEWSTARTLVKDALDIQQRFGLFALAALSINTLALIAIREGEYASAVERSRIALNIFRTLGFRRGIGLALTALAEAQRRRAGRSITWSPARKVADLGRSREWVREAVEIFEQEQERLRQIEALIELGCTCRDWVHIRREHPDWRDNVDRLYEEARQALEKAAQLAGDQYLYRRVDALVNLAWLNFYAGKEEALQKVMVDAEAVVPQEYFFDPSRGEPTIGRENAITLLWPQLGKLYVLRGVVAFQAAIDTGKSPVQPDADKLAEAGEYFTLGLEYSRLFGREYQGLIQAQETIYSYLKRQQTEVLEALAQAVLHAEEKLGLVRSGKAPSLMQTFLKERALWFPEDD